MQHNLRSYDSREVRHLLCGVLLTVPKLVAYRQVPEPMFHGMTKRFRCRKQTKTHVSVRLWNQEGNSG